MTAIAAVLWGMSADQLAEVLAPADPTRCGWLDGTCARAIYGGGWLCLQHLVFLAQRAAMR